MATGVLPLLLGRAARAASLLPETEKEYDAAFALGAATDTEDSSGRVTERTDARVSEQALRAALPAFCGDILQIPPMYSAVHRDGRRLYELAREGLVGGARAAPRARGSAGADVLRRGKPDGHALDPLLEGHVRAHADLRSLARACGTLGMMTSLRAHGRLRLFARGRRAARDGAGPRGIGGSSMRLSARWTASSPLCGGWRVSGAQAVRFANGGRARPAGAPALRTAPGRARGTAPALRPGAACSWAWRRKETAPSPCCGCSACRRKRPRKRGNQKDEALSRPAPGRPRDGRGHRRVRRPASRPPARHRRGDRPRRVAGRVHI